jgi:hypothetical protein
MDYSALSKEKSRVILKEVETGIPKEEREIKIGENYFKKYSCNSFHENIYAWWSIRTTTAQYKI